MAIQGIIVGFANPENLDQSLVIVGRGSHYLLLLNGRLEGEPIVDLGDALETFKVEAVKHCLGHWLRATEVLSSNALNVSKVSKTRNERYDEFVARAQKS